MIIIVIMIIVIIVYYATQAADRKHTQNIKTTKHDKNWKF